MREEFESGYVHCLCLFVVRLPLIVRFVGMTIAPLGYEEGSLTALWPIFMLE